jgi:hypothetical protein
MARSPFQGTYSPNLRPTVVHAPDTLVYINGEPDVVGCPQCRRKFDLSKYITSVQVDLSVESVPGSANITLSVPRHVIDDFMFDGVPLISPMMEVEIFSKGYYLVEGLPQYYPTFWGLVTEVNDNYSGGEHTVTIACADILKWWDICRMNINPAFTAPKGQLGTNIFGNVFYGTNPYDVIYTLANMAFGDVILGTGSLISLYKEGQQKKTFDTALGDIMAYWQQRFGKIRSNLLLYGMNGVAIRGADLDVAYQKGKATKSKPFASAAVRNANGGDANAQAIFDPTSPNVHAFRTQFMNAGQVNFWQSEYQSKLEIANGAKEAIGFEFYMDVTGDIVFKPPFFNLDVLSNKPVSWIQDIDIIDWDFGDSEAEVVTQLSIQGNFGGNTDYGLDEAATPYTSVTDYHLLRKFGWRSQTYNSEFMGDPLLMFYHGLDIIDRMNAKEFRATVTIPMRPELRLGFPIYIAPKDQVWYIQGISHSIQFGGRATTTLTLTARRTKFKAPKGISTLKMTGETKPPAAPTGKKSSPTKQEQKTAAPTKDAPPKETKKGPPTTQQLARKTFSLDIGGAAQMPAVDLDPEKPETMTPYEPLILRHPKTGRICGYPNVVMVYTRPFKDLTLDQFKRVTGKGAGKGQVKQASAKSQQAINQIRDKGLAAAADAFNDTTVDKLVEKYNANRWRYGLNSAGVFVYAHDTEKALLSFALLPAANITVTQQGQATKTSPFSHSAMIRPVSDERGFEVIGHFRYGRGVSLRDGRLVLTDGKNEAASVGLQLALSGDLFASLTAQSQGLTAVVSAYSSPAETLARLGDDDLQTAAVIQPNTMDASTAKFVNTGDSFVDTAPLGSPEQKGLPPSVEASQLSRALTLAEMGVKGESIPAEDNCVCMSGRADLAFINVGYSVKTLNPASPEVEVFNQGGAANLQDGTVEGVTSFGDRELAKELGGGAAKPIAAELKYDAVRTKVEEYLSTLYGALDDVHHQYEQAIRGKLLDPGGDAPSGLGLGDPSNPENADFEPPFSAPNRANLGDPIATALQGSSARSDIKKSWQKFGESLDKKSKLFAKQQKVLSLQNQLADLKKKKADATGGGVFQNTFKDQGPPPDTSAIDKEIAAVTAELTKLQMEIQAGIALCPLAFRWGTAPASRSSTRTTPTPTPAWGSSPTWTSCT